jgi:hypothetical protein
MTDEINEMRRSFRQTESADCELSRFFNPAIMSAGSQSEEPNLKSLL